MDFQYAKSRPSCTCRAGLSVPLTSRLRLQCTRARWLEFRARGEHQLIVIPHLAEIALIVGGIPIAIGMLHKIYFIYLPKRAIALYGEKDPERLRRYLERVVATPSLYGQAVKLVPQLSLVGIYSSSGQHAQAVAHAHKYLEALRKSRDLGGHGALEADMRRRLADSLEALGQVEEAAEERRRAAQDVDRAPPDTLRHLAQGTLLEREHKYEDAYAAFLKALELTPASQTSVRIECMLHLVMAAYNSARPVECLRWADEAIAIGASGKFLRMAHRMAGLACGNLGRLPESEQHCRQAYDAAAADNDTPAMAEILASLSDCLRKRGKLVEANAACVKATEMHPKAARQSLAVQSQILREWGRFEDALAILAGFNETKPLVLPSHENRIRAVWALDTARIKAECGQANSAWTDIEQALAILKTDAKLGLKCQAASAWVLAARGLADESQRVATEVKSKLVAFERDPSTCRGIMYDLGMAACTRGDHHAGIECWTRYLELSPDPIYQPSAHYHRGECYRQLEQLTEARDDYQAAVATDFDTHYARLARRRLSGFTLA